MRTDQKLLLIRTAVLGLTYILAFAVRLFPVVRHEAMIHEYDPHFNYRATEILSERGLKGFMEWFDPASWYPLGRAAGPTLYPGLMATAAALYSAVRLLFPSVTLTQACVFTPPFFAGNAAILAYYLGKEIWGDDRAVGLVAAALFAVCPGYTSRSVAGAYDNEAVAIFAMMLVFYLFLRALRTGSPAWAAAAAGAYFYMASSWGGYVFVANLLPLYVVVLLVAGRYSTRLYVAYSCMYVLGSLLAMQVPFVGFQHVRSGEHMAALGVFLLLQVFALLDLVKHLLSHDPTLFTAFLRIALTAAASIAAVVAAVATATGSITPWTGRLYSLLNPTNVKQYSPIIASVLEHEPTTWSAFLYDFHALLLFLFPAGLYFCVVKRCTSEAATFLALYGVTSMYFSGIMVRLLLVATPAVCLLGAVAASVTMRNLAKVTREDDEKITGGTMNDRCGPQKRLSKKQLASLDARAPLPHQGTAAAVLLVGIMYLFAEYVVHSNWVTSDSYSSPSVVWFSNSGKVIDDYREAYSWLRHNTAPEAKVAAWWDYGYQISALANRTVVIDNNTWNSTHIAMVGRAMASDEEEAYRVLRSLDVDYVLVVFGGVSGYDSDDIDKFLWMVRIAEGVYTDIHEDDYLVDGVYRVDSGGAPKMLNSLMYKLSYYRFAEWTAFEGTTIGHDFARSVEIGNEGVLLSHFEEAFTTYNWIVRIYKVKPPCKRR